MLLRKFCTLPTWQRAAIAPPLPAAAIQETPHRQTAVVRDTLTPRKFDHANTTPTENGLQADAL